MSQQTIGIGSAANDATGDPIRTALAKANENFTELYGRIVTGTVALVAGSAVVPQTSVAAGSRIFLCSQADGGTPGWLRVSARSAGVSFTITSSSGTDSSTIAWALLVPDP